MPMKIYRCFTVIVFAIVSLSAFAQNDSTKTSLFKLNGMEKSTEPLVIIDGNKQYIRGSAILKDIDPANIESVSVFKGEKAIQNYGVDGTDGVISITTKSGMLSRIIPKEDVSIFLKGSNNPLKTPLYVLDGNIIQESEVKLIKPDTISSVNILNGKNATSLYGISGLNGVVIINSKVKPTLYIKQ